MTLRLPRLRTDTAMVDDKGRPTREFSRYWDTVLNAIEAAFDGLILNGGQAASALALASDLQNAFNDVLAGLPSASDADELRSKVAELQVLMPPN